MLKKLIRLNLDDMGLVLGVVGGLFLLIHVGTAVILHFFFESEHSSLMISGTVLPITSAIVILMISLGHTLAAYTMAVKFSQTRRRALGLTLGLVGFEALCSMGLAALLALLERAVAPQFWMWLTGADGLSIGQGGHSFLLTAGDNPLLVEDFSLDWWWFPLLAVAAMVLGLIIGAIILRFGRRGGWTLWCIWMICCFAPPDSALGRALVHLPLAVHGDTGRNLCSGLPRLVGVVPASRPHQKLIHSGGILYERQQAF